MADGLPYGSTVAEDNGPMQLYIYRNNEQTGPFDEEAILAQLKSGGLSPDDLGIRKGEVNWQRLGDIFAGRIPSTPFAPAPQPMTNAAGQNFAAAPAPKANASGCRVAAGLLMLIFGLIMFVGGIAFAIATPYMYYMPLCPIAESDYAEMQDLKAKYDAARGTYDETMAKVRLMQAMDSYDSSSRMCAEERGTRQLFIIGAVAVAIIGFFAAIIGLFVRRVRRT